MSTKIKILLFIVFISFGQLFAQSNDSLNINKKTLTSEQANELATHFLNMGKEVETIRQQQYDKLTPTERDDMKELGWRILEYSSTLYTLSAILVINDIQKKLKK